VGIFAFCSDDPQKIEEAQAVMDYRLYNFERGRFDEIPSYELAKEHTYTDAEWQRVLFNRQRMAVGTPQQMRQRLGALADETGVEELVISTFTEHFADRLRSYELLATTFGLKPHSAAAAAQEHQYHRNSL
jgi:alkanesulfonate monooxygenase SsuD/methylene tetrahydromethanopterin reductase-like flavin-dependent oxidoreductase (luciferase family)